MMQRKYAHGLAILTLIFAFIFIILVVVLFFNQETFRNLVTSQSDLTNSMYEVKLYRLARMPYEFLFAAGVLFLVACILLFPRQSNRVLKHFQGKRVFIVGVLVLALFFIILNVYYMNHVRVLGPDEGFHINNAKLVYEGKIPYLDFPYIKGFIYPYLHGFFLSLTGFSFWSSRIWALLFKAAAGVLVFLAAKNLAGRIAAFIAALFYVMNLGILSYYVGDFPGGPLTMLLLISAVYLLTTKMSRMKKIVFVTLILVILMDVRLTAAPFLVIFLLFLLIDWWLLKRAKEFLVALGVTVGSFVAIYLVPLLLQPERTVNGIYRYALFRSTFMPILTKQLVFGFDITTMSGMLANKLLNLVFAAEFYNILFGLFFLIVAVFLFRRVRTWTGGVCGVRGHFRKWKSIYASLAEDDKTLFFMALGILGVGIGALVLLNPTDFYYYSILFPLMAIFCAVMTTRFIYLQSMVERSLFVAILILLILLTPVLQYPREQYIIHEGKIINVLEELDGVGSYVASITKPGDELMTFETPIAVAAGRHVLPGMERSMFLYIPNISDEKTVELGIVNTNKLVAYLGERRPAAIILSQLYTYETFTLIPEEYARFNESLHRNYILVRSYEDFLDWGILDVYVRKD